LANLASDSFCIRNIVGPEQVNQLDLNGVCYKDQAFVAMDKHMHPDTLKAVIFEAGASMRTIIYNTNSGKSNQFANN
jgi:hypothetical protein